MKNKGKVSRHTTGSGQILFMAAARPLNNLKSGKSEHSIKLKLANDDAAVAHLSEVANYKVDTKTNRAQKDGVTINFTSEFAPKVYNAEGVELTGNDIPFFDGRIDTGMAGVVYNVIDYGDNQIVRLAAIKLLDLNLAPREKGKSVSELENAIKAI